MASKAKTKVYRGHTYVEFYAIVNERNKKQVKAKQEDFKERLGIRTVLLRGTNTVWSLWARETDYNRWMKTMPKTEAEAKRRLRDAGVR